MLENDKFKDKQKRTCLVLREKTVDRMNHLLLNETESETSQTHTNERNRVIVVCIADINVAIAKRNE